MDVADLRPKLGTAAQRYTNFPGVAAEARATTLLLDGAADIAQQAAADHGDPFAYHGSLLARLPERLSDVQAIKRAETVIARSRTESAKYWALPALSNAYDAWIASGYDNALAAVRDRVREQLGMPPRRTGAGQGLADVARRAGLDPSFDLPVTPTNGAGAAHHADSAIQTLLYEDDMQMTLARMREVVRLSIEETGVNPLFCVFGFLEWYEDTNSETPLHAPLANFCPRLLDHSFSLAEAGAGAVEFSLLYLNETVADGYSPGRERRTLQCILANHQAVRRHRQQIDARFRGIRVHFAH